MTFNLQTYNTVDEVILEELLPQGVRELGEHVEQGEEVGQPEVVGGDGSVLGGLKAALVHVAAGGDTLEVFADIGGPVHPAVVTEGELNEELGE